MTRPAYYNEIDPWCCDRLRERIAAGDIPYGHVDERDVRLVTPADLEGYGQLHFFAGIGGGAIACRLAGVPDDFRIITGGVPCQPASVAGKRLGENDERWLWPAFLALVGDRVLRSHYVLAENPTGILTLADGGAFAGILAALAAVGRDAEWTCVSAADVGASHERDRLWLVAYPRCGSVQPERFPGGVGGAAAEDGSEGLQRERRAAAAPGRGEDGGAGEVADADGAGLGERRGAVAVGAEFPAPEYGREGGSGGEMADADAHGSRGLEAHDGAHGAMDVESGHDADGRRDHQQREVGREADGGRHGARPAQPAVGGAAHGLPAYLGGTEWPAPPGTPQREWEEPRLVPDIGPDGRKALAAYGNAWVPQAAVPALHVILAHAELDG